MPCPECKSEDIMIGDNKSIPGWKLERYECFDCECEWEWEITEKMTVTKHGNKYEGK